MSSLNYGFVTVNYQGYFKTLMASNSLNPSNTHAIKFGLQVCLKSLKLFLDIIDSNQDYSPLF